MKLSYPNFKKQLDLGVSLFMLGFLLPLMLGIGAISFVSQGRPILFLQVRPGLHGKPFRLFKFRTMALHPIPESPELKENSPTRWGRFLRATSLDELPQLVNILRGEMSFVGPRPLLMEYLPLYSSTQKRRHHVRPGLTGLAQIEGRNQVDWEKRLALDVMYADNQSLAMDIEIILRSVFLVLTRKGVRANGSEIMPRFRGGEVSDAE